MYIILHMQDVRTSLFKLENS